MSVADSNGIKKTTSFMSPSNKVGPAETTNNQQTRPESSGLHKGILKPTQNHNGTAVQAPERDQRHTPKENGVAPGSRHVQIEEEYSTPEETETNRPNMDDLIQPEMEVPKVTENKLPLNIAKVCFDATDGIFKIVFAALLFTVILACLIISKGCMLFIAHQMNLDVIFRRIGYRPTDLEDLEWAQGEDLGNFTNLTFTCSVPECRFTADTNCAQVESVRWIWAMYLVQCLTYVTTFCRSLWKICFKKKHMPAISVVLWTMVPETLSTIGTFMMLHMLLPHWDVTRGLFILSAIAFIPSLLNCLNTPPDKSTISTVTDILVTVAIGTAMFIWVITSAADEVSLSDEGTQDQLTDVCMNVSLIGFEFSQDSYMYSTSTPPPAAPNSTDTPPPAAPNSTDTPPYSYLLPKDHQLPESASDIWCLPLALLFISVNYWQNFIDRYTKSLGSVGRFLIQLRKDHARGKTKTDLLLSPYKMCLTLLLVTIYYEVDPQMDLGALYSSTHFYNNEETCGDQSSGPFHSDWLAVVGILLACSIVCMCASDLAIQSKLQVFSFTIPLVLATPLTYFIFMAACTGCEGWDFGTSFYWNCFSGHDGYNETLAQTYGYFGFFWWISMLWIVRHLWHPKLERLAMLDKIFTQSFPSVVFLEQSLMLSRRRNDQEVQKPKQSQESYDRRRQSVQDSSLNDSRVPTMTPEKLDVPFIYMCATMWHETKDEMVTMLTSIFRMNIDQCARYMNRFVHKLEEPDYYEFEVDIYFDDAFKKDPDDPVLVSVNDFVKDFAESMDKAASIAYNVGVTMTPPTKCETPYGGQLVWKLPLTKTKVVLHLKDKTKIRNKKRWSQVMYMKSLLGRGIEGQRAESAVKDYVARHTFILALDGDIDFQPDAVLHLVDLMRRDPKVAAACGRIHPTGSGPMVWYQKFEYSISHWLQKSTEHMFGCVLCSPGCFSLFRASALLDDKIPDIYATVAEEPINFVQYDQGEDRWLCTLLIQKGHRIEYSAAADAFTNAPEEFNEFFNQRRRWITSTFANLLDIIGNGVQIAKDNETISLLYMLYQLVLFVSSIVGPATIFLLLCGSFELVFGLDAFLAAIIGIVPVVIFMVLCFKTKTSTQLAYASILTVIYAVLQMVVLAGMLRVMVDEGLCGSSTIFFLFIVGVFILSALVHPFEMTNILHSFIFYLFIPSVYLLLIVYSLCNVNQISWGTREAKTPGQSEKQKKKKGINKWASYVGLNIETNTDGDEDEEDSCCDSLVCCTHRQTDERLTNIEAQIMIMSAQTQGHNNNDNPKTDKGKTSPQSQQNQNIPSNTESVSMEANIPQKYRGPWIDDPVLGKGDVYQISEEETEFWEELIRTKLLPEDPKGDKQMKIKEGLNELRNKAVFSFFIIDMLMIAFILALKMSAEYGMEDGIVIKYTCSLDDNATEHSLDPIGLAFIAVFGLLMVVQVFGMLLHRVFTFIQYISTVLLCRSTKIMPTLDESTTTRRNYEFACAMTRFDHDMEQDSEPEVTVSEAGSQTSLRDDNIMHKASKRRKSYTQVQLEKINDARQWALSRMMRSNEEQHPCAGPSGSRRKESVFQLVVDSIKKRKSLGTMAEEGNVPDVEVTRQDEEVLISRQRRVVANILKPK